MKKINKNNLVILIVFILSATLIISDFLVITISTILGHTAGWTWFGFITFMAAGIFLDWSYTELKEILDNKKEK